MNVRRLLWSRGLLVLLLPMLLFTPPSLANADDLKTEIQNFTLPGRPRLGSDATGPFIAYYHGTLDPNALFLSAQRLDETGAPIGEPITIAEGLTRAPRFDVSDGWGIAYLITEPATETLPERTRVFVRESLEGPEKELTVGYEQATKRSPVYHYPLVGWLQGEPSSVTVDSIASVDLTKGTTVALAMLPSIFTTVGSSVTELKIADFTAVLLWRNGSTGLSEVWIRPLFSGWTQISSPGLFADNVVTGGPWVAWKESPFGAPERSIRAYNHLTNDARVVTAPSTSLFGPHFASEEYFGYSYASVIDGAETYLYKIQDATNHLLVKGVYEVGAGISMLANMVTLYAHPDQVSVIKFAECIDDDGDGVCISKDACPTENATGFDANMDGCIDSIDGMAEFLATLVTEGLIDATLQNSLLSKVHTATASMDRDSVCAAINEFSALKNQIIAQTDKKISPKAATDVIAYIDNVITLQLAALPPSSTCP